MSNDTWVLYYTAPFTRRRWVSPKQAVYSMVHCILCRGRFAHRILSTGKRHRDTDAVRLAAPPRRQLWCAPGWARSTNLTLITKLVLLCFCDVRSFVGSWQLPPLRHLHTTDLRLAFDAISGPQRFVGRTSFMICFICGGLGGLGAGCPASKSRCFSISYDACVQRHLSQQSTLRGMRRPTHITCCSASISSRIICCCSDTKKLNAVLARRGLSRKSKFEFRAFLRCASASAYSSFSRSYRNFAALAYDYNKVSDIRSPELGNPNKHACLTIAPAQRTAHGPLV